MKIILSGCTGSMGKVITELISKEKIKMEIVAGFARKKRRDFKYPIYNNFTEIREEADLILDFSSHSCLEEILDYALKMNLPVVLASTGYSKDQERQIKSASNEIPILYSGNMSIGINVLLNVLEKLSRDLEGFNIEIIEKHHKYKSDSPSGTANMLFDAVNKGRDGSLLKKEGRHGIDLLRKPEEVGIHAIRGGTITGEHSVIFAGIDEIIEIKHIASSKTIFAIGALKACKFIIDREVGLYDMKDVF